LRPLWRALLRKSLPGDAFRSLSAAVFGLGDSGYPLFCVTAKKLSRRLAALGAAELLPLGLGDDQHPLGYEAQLEGWARALWAALRRACPLAEGAAEPAADAPPPPPPLRLHVRVLEGAAPPLDEAGELRACVAAAAALEAALGGQPPSPAPFGPAAPFLAPLLHSRRLAGAAGAREVVHAELALGGGGPRLEPGDALALWPLPPSGAAAARALLERLGVAPAARLEVRAAGGAFEAAALALVRGCLDLQAPPRRSLLLMLAPHAAAPHEAARLAHFGSAAGREELARYCVRERRGLLDLLLDFPSLRPPLGALLQAGPRLRPRLFSACADQAAAADARAELCVAVVRWSTPLGRARAGLLTPWLAEAPPGALFACWAARGALALPGCTAPLLMVGPGTGLAPFRAFLQRRAAAAARGERPAPAALFFGCRSAEEELYAEEWAGWRAGPLAPPGGLFAAHSRAGPKRHVTHLLREQGPLVWGLLAQPEAHVFVAGSAGRMPADVFDALADVVQQHAPGLAARENAVAFLRRLEAARRYQTEVWSAGATGA